MKKLLLLTLLCFSINGFAHNWKKVTKFSNGLVYVDVDSIKKDDNVIYFWVLWDLFKPTPVATRGARSMDNVFYSYSSISKYKADYSVDVYIILSSSPYTLQMGKGRKITTTTPNSMFYPKPNETESKLIKFACDNAK